MSKKPTKNVLKELATELDVFDDMFPTLLELLEEKRIIAQKEFEGKMKMKIERTKDKKSYRDIQFGKKDV